MRFEKASIEGLVQCFPSIYKDERGLFFESYNHQSFVKNAVPEDFVQDNHSWSKKGVVRGLHFQKSPYAQGKLVRCVTGKVIDVVVDIRPDSPTYGQHEKFILDAKIGNMLYVPGGFAHGFLTLEESIFVYKCTNFWNKEAESGILWNDTQLQIDWGISNPIVSEKDLKLPTFKELK